LTINRTRRAPLFPGLAALLLFRQSPAGLDLLAAGQITLLLAAIRNAWDMMLWIVIRAPAPNVGDRDGT
jgi:hypothetical protein